MTVVFFRLSVLLIFCGIFSGSLYAGKSITVSTCTRDLSTVMEIDPHIRVPGCINDIRHQIYDTLYEFDDDGNISESLVKSCEVKYYSEDIDFNAEMDVLCTLKEGIYFHNSSPLGVDDVIFSFDRLKRYSLAPYVDFINTVSVTPANELKFILKYNIKGRENPREWLFTRFKYATARYLYIANRKYFEGSAKWALEYPSGTGPFYYVNWKLWDRRYVRSQIILRKNESYWKTGYPKIDEILFRFLVPELWVDHFIQDSLSLLPRLTFYNYEKMKKVKSARGTFKINRRLVYSYRYLLFNKKSLRLGTEPMLKEAINMGINRSVIVNGILEGEAYVNSQQSLTASTVYPEKFKEYQFNPAISRAIVRKYLKKRRVRDYKLKLSLLLVDGIEENMVAQKIRNMLYSAGFDVALHRKDACTYFSLVNGEGGGDYDLYLYKVEENPSFLTPVVDRHLQNGGVQLYQAYSFYSYSTKISGYMPPAEGGINLCKIE
ncbi:MAG: ABC transporter substrate-binding protein [Oligoflexia bacterium]|nr:ABC transporter substrate-binding protein [Oligoflexia bacterium]